ncbi:MAG: tetratricopeptide repeat protein [Pyrinomonadaceae bacterium]|nr:tetratricopeptide repeat protein [Pyrinomonadaceae bacterium]
MTNQTSPSTERKQDTRSWIHYAVLIVGLIICGWGIWSSGREGLSIFVTSYAAATNQLDAADRAVRFGPSSSEAHYLRARLLSDNSLRTEAIRAYEQAAALRPRDYVLWLELGRARDQVNDVEGALAAFRESMRLAPFYAQPHWQLGNTLLRSGRRDEALAELRRAAASNPTLLPSAIGLAWGVLNKDPRAVEKALQPGDPAAHLALATFFARHGKAAEAINHVRAAGDLSNEQRRTLLNELLATRNFSEAYTVWSSGRKAGNPEGLSAIANAGFEETISLDDRGFGWQVGIDPETVQTTLDPSAPHSGSYSLRLDWSGDSDPLAPIVSQLVLVEPNTRYRLSFAARTHELLTIGLPVVAIADPSSDNQVILQQSDSFSRGTSGWQSYAVEFATPGTTRAVRIVIRRQKCETVPCAAIGHAWVDGFSLEKL